MAEAFTEVDTESLKARCCNKEVKYKTGIFGTYYACCEICGTIILMKDEQWLVVKK